MQEDLSPDLRRTLLRKMLLIRLCEEKVVELYPEQEMRCPVHLSIGQEATAAGMCAALSKEDLVVGGHRAHSHYIAKGGSINQLFAEFYGKATGCCGGIGGSMHLVDQDAGFAYCTSIVGGCFPVSVGLALAQQYQNTGRTTVLFLGDAGVEEGVFHESANLAALFDLPIVFFCENNLFSVYTPLDQRQPTRPIHELAAGHGLKSFNVDGNDVEAVYRVAAEAYAHSSSGAGPTFIEASTYRYREHCGPNYDNDLGYRNMDEVRYWEDRCPVKLHKQQLLEAGIIDKASYAAMEAEVNDEVAAAVKFAKESPLPGKEALFQNLYPPTAGGLL